MIEIKQCISQLCQAELQSTAVLTPNIMEKGDKSTDAVVESDIEEH